MTNTSRGLTDELDRRPSRDPDHEEAGKAAQSLGKPVAVEHRILRPDGEARWIYDRSFSVATIMGGGQPGPPPI